MSGLEAIGWLLLLPALVALIGLWAVALGW